METAALLKELALLMDLAGVAPYAVRSYQHAARICEHFPAERHREQREEMIGRIPDLGREILGHLSQLQQTGCLKPLEQLRALYPPTLAELFGVPGLGAKRIHQIFTELGVDSLHSLGLACRESRVAGLRGFGPKAQAKIMEGVIFAQEHRGFHLLNRGFETGHLLYQHIAACPGVERLEIVGDLRRGTEYVTEVELLAACSDEAVAQHWMHQWSQLRSVSDQGPHHLRAVTKTGMPVCLITAGPPAYHTMLTYRTGNAGHWTALQQRARQGGGRLEPHGLFRPDGNQVACAKEADVYHALGLPFIPPELREGQGEWEMTRIPRLVTLGDLKGLFHCHSTYSDGLNSLVELASAAQGRGYQYVVVTDHSKSARLAGGMSEARVLEQHEEIDSINQILAGFQILKGIEVDILPDGSLDYPDALLKKFDFVFASVHEGLEMTADQATRRILKAVAHPCVDAIAHPTGRLLMSRHGYPLHLEAVLDACAAHHTALEINANCRRLDLDWRGIRRARAKGVRMVVSPDAHSIERLDVVSFGVQMARKGMLQPADVLNCLSPGELKTWRQNR